MEQEQRAPVQTRQPAAQSSGKRSAAALSKATLFANPVPLYRESHTGWQILPDAASLLYTLAWTLSFSTRALFSRHSLGELTRNKIAMESYLKERLEGYWDPATRSVWITSRSLSNVVTPRKTENSWIDTLWVRGFFGKGSLSRSEPTWYQREKNRVTGVNVPTAEDLTKQRRLDRKVLQLQKAKERADEREKLASARENPTSSADSHAEVQVNDTSSVNGEPMDTSEATGILRAVKQGRALGSKQHVLEAEQKRKIEDDGVDIPNLEHTQLQREEAFFLVFAIGSLQIYLRPTVSAPSPFPLAMQQVWQMFLQSSIRITLPFTSPTGAIIRPDNPFILSYLVYHHYRSLGWVVRNGVKFCVVWVLYKGSDGTARMRGGAGPVGGHAEFSVVVVPTYEDTSDALTSRELMRYRDWRWLHTVNRVNSGVKKTIILAFVTIPPMVSYTRSKTGHFEELGSPACLSRYQIKEVSIRRFIPTRMRD